MFCDSKPIHKDTENKLESQCIYDLDEAFTHFENKAIELEGKISNKIINNQCDCCKSVIIKIFIDVNV